MGPLNELSLNTHSRLSVSSWAQSYPEVQTNPHFWNTVDECHCSTVRGENVLTAEIITLTVPMSQLQCSCSLKKNKKHLLWLQGHYSSLLLGLNGSLSQFDFLMDWDVSRLALCALAGPNPGPERPLSVSIQFRRLPTGNEGFRGHW